MDQVSEHTARMALGAVLKRIERFQERHEADEKRIGELEAKLQGATHRAVLLKGYKDRWVDRAQKAEALVTELREALEQSQLALDHLWAAIGDRLLAKGPLSREYANATATRVREARDAAERVLSEVSEGS